jgi:hypothetical protein
MLHVYDEQLRAAESADVSYSEFVAGLLRAQWHDRQENALEWRIGRANLPERHRLRKPLLMPNGTSRIAAEWFPFERKSSGRSLQERTSKRNATLYGWRCSECRSSGRREHSRRVRSGTAKPLAYVLDAMLGMPFRPCA